MSKMEYQKILDYFEDGLEEFMTKLPYSPDHFKFDQHQPKEWLRHILDKDYLNYLDRYYLDALYELYLITSEISECAQIYKDIENTLAKFFRDPNAEAMGLDVLNNFGFYQYFGNSLIEDRKRLMQHPENLGLSFFESNDFSVWPISIFYALFTARLAKELNMPSKIESCNLAAVRQTDQGKMFALLHTTFAKDKEFYNVCFLPLLSLVDTQMLSHIDDDMEKLDTATRIKHRFMLGLKDGKKIEVYKLLGLLTGYKHELDSGEYDYFEALVRFRDGDYEGAIRYTNKLKQDDIDFPSACAIQLACWAELGDFDGFINCIRANTAASFPKKKSKGKSPASNITSPNTKIIFNATHILVQFSKCILNMSDYGIMERFEQCLSMLKSALKRGGISLEESETFMQEGTRLSAKIVEELIHINEQNRLAANLSNDFLPSQKNQQRATKLMIALGILCVNEQELLEKVIEFSENEDDDTAAQIKEEICANIVEALVAAANHTGDVELVVKNVTTAFLFLHNIGMKDKFCSNVIENLEFFEKFIHRDNIAPILQLAYVELTMRGTKNEKLFQLVQEHCTVSEETIKTAKITKALTPTGKSFYSTALWLYETTANDDFGWKDAGMISLEFYKILEVEVNTKIIATLINRINKTALNQAYNARRSMLRNQDKADYTSRWGKNISTLNNALDGQNYHGFESGALYHLFKSLDSEYDPNDDLARYLKPQLEQICDYHAAQLEWLFSDNNRQKFRNPPAHTNYTPFNIARECKSLVENALINLNANMKI